MEAMFSHANWGTPVGLGIFMLCMGVGMGVFFWGIGKLPQDKK